MPMAGGFMTSSWRRAVTRNTRAQPQPSVAISTVTCCGILSGGLLAELLGEPDENPLGTPDVA